MKDRFYKTDKQLVEHCIETFLAASQSMLEQARGNAAGWDGLTDEKAVQEARLAWSAMQRARLFCFEPERWATLYDAADRYATESLAGLKHSGRSAIHLRQMDMFRDCGILWGLTESEAVARGYMYSPDSGKVGLTEAGVHALHEDVVNKLGEDRRQGFHEMQEVYDVAIEENRPDVAAMAAAQMVDAVTRPAPEDLEKLLSAHEDYGVRWPFPEPLPFDSCFFSFGAQLNLSYSPRALHARVQPSELSSMSVTKLFLLGYLVAWEGEEPFVFTVVGFEFHDDRNRDVAVPTPIGLIKTYENGEWLQPMSLDPWILSMLVKAINDHKQIMESHPASLFSRMARKRASKSAKQTLPLPAPYYLVNLKDEFIAAPAKLKKTSSGRPVEWSHRWDVRGHECVRIERGQMPVDPKEVAKLKKRGYRIYEGMSLIADDAARLLKRGVRAPAPQEWIAVLSYWRPSFVKGPEEKPYVPAARVEAT